MRYIIWDFDGTLAYRRGMWSGTLIEVLRREMPERLTTVDEIRPYMQAGFPWNNPGQPHARVKSADEWWEDLLPLFESAFQKGAELGANEAKRLARQVRAAYVDPNFWQLFEDTIPCLNTLRAHGWRHVVLSNHVPELRSLIEALGLSPLIEQVFNSAETGFEKPHPDAFGAVLAAIRGATEVWMVGDSFAADVAGARAVGLPAVLVRSLHPEAVHCCQTLTELPMVLRGTYPADCPGPADPPCGRPDSG